MVRIVGDRVSGNEPAREQSNAGKKMTKRKRERKKWCVKRQGDVGRGKSGSTVRAH